MRKISSAVLTAVFCLALMAAGVSGNDAYSQKAREYGVRDYSIAFYDNGNLSYENFGNGVDENTVFELASNGKMIAAYVALKLVDEGKIGLDDKVGPYLDSRLVTTDKRMQDITLRQLLSHTAGFSPSFELGVDKKIYSDPGDRFCYSGVGYIYLQSVIENVSGMTMDQAAKHYVFGPLGMTQSTFENSGTITPYMRLSSAVLYSMAVFTASGTVLFLIFLIIGKATRFKHFTMKTGVLISYILAGMINTLFLLFKFVSKTALLFWICFAALGLVMFITRKKEKLFYSCVPGFIVLVFVLGFAVPVSIPVTNDIVPKEANCAYTLRSTGRDMSIFAQELMNEYSRDAYDAASEMFMPAVDIDGQNKWGLGMAIEYHDGHQTHWHSGINPGFQSLFVLYPEQDRFIIVLTNSDNGLAFARDTARDYLDVDCSWEIPRN